jgi:hypothetical protein
VNRPTAAGSGPAPRGIDRREAIRRATWLLGGASLIGGSGLLAACESGDRPSGREPIGDFTLDDIALLDEIAETILPETDTPGAKAAAVGPFMALMVTDVYEVREQEVFRQGMDRIRRESVDRHGSGFLEIEPAQRTALLTELDQEQLDYVPPPPPEGEDGSPPHFFRMMKQLTLLGYFTSEIGATQALQYVESPGRYDPCVPYTEGERDWADHA